MALSVVELFSSVTNRTTSLVYAVGEFIIDITPVMSLENIETLGNYQKVVLLAPRYFQLFLVEFWVFVS